MANFSENWARYSTTCDAAAGSVPPLFSQCRMSLAYAALVELAVAAAISVSAPSENVLKRCFGGFSELLAGCIAESVETVVFELVFDAVLVIVFVVFFVMILVLAA